nr:uncharacterized protein LOC126539114 isoform X2 [Dermacentor andersoni]
MKTLLSLFFLQLRRPHSATAYRNKLDYLGFPNVTNTSAVKLQHYGYSFAADDISWLKSQLSTVADKVKQLHKDNGLLTAGLAYYSRPDAATDSNLANIKSIMTSINGMLNAAQDKNTTILKTTFLAVKLSGKDSSARNDASALQELKGIANIDLLILLTHLVNVPSHPNCKILPLSRYAADALDSIEPPSMERLLNSIDKLKEAKFRVAFSTSFAMYLFKPLGGLKDTTKFGDKCMHSFYDDMSALCDVPDASIIEDKKNPAVSTATYSNKQSGIFMVFETNNATRVKDHRINGENGAALKGLPPAHAALSDQAQKGCRAEGSTWVNAASRSSRQYIRTARR